MIKLQVRYAVVRLDGYQPYIRLLNPWGKTLSLGAKVFTPARDMAAPRAYIHRVTES